MKEPDASQFNPENYELPLKGHVYCKILFDEVFHKMDLLPDTAWRNFMGSQEITLQIESNRVKELIREEEPHLYVW